MAGTIAIHTFQNAVTSVGDGAIYKVNFETTLRVDIYGSATSRTVQFFHINMNGEQVALKGYNVTTASLSTSTSGTTSETWIFDITGLDKIQMKVSAISGGNLSVIGKVMLER